MRKFVDVKKGSTGIDVFILQALLRGLQYVGADGKPIEVDGQCGDNTVYAINTFQTLQRAYGYECTTTGENTGIFDSTCWERLMGN